MAFGSEFVYGRNTVVMGQIYNELWDCIGSINEDGYLFDSLNHSIARITEAGYIISLSSFDSFGKIDEDGTIRDCSGTVVGRIQADGYVYIHSTRVGRISSSFIEKITPKAWNAGQTSTYGGRSNISYEPTTSSYNYSSPSFLTSKYFIMLVVGLVLGIVAMINGVGGGILLLVAGPIVVFLLYFIYKIFN